MVDIIPSSQLVIGHGAFSIVYRAKLKSVSSKTILHSFKSDRIKMCKSPKNLHSLSGKTKKSKFKHCKNGLSWSQSVLYNCFMIGASQRLQCLLK